MDDDSRRHLDDHRSDDLAAIVLASGSRRRRVDAPEFVPVDSRPAVQPGFDARSAAVLALVVALLAAVVGWSTSVGDPAVDAPTRVNQPVAGATDAADRVATPTDAQTTSAFGGGDAAASTPPPGVDLTIGRIVPARSASGAGLVAVGVGNAGADPFDARGGANLVLLLDGEVVATEPLSSVDAGASTRVSVALDWCPAGTVALTAVVDPGAVVKEADERNNATSRSARFGC